MKSGKKRVSLMLDPNVIEEIEKLAEEDERSLSQFINRVLKEYFKTRQDQHK